MSTERESLFAGLCCASCQRDAMHLFPDYFGPGRICARCYLTLLAVKKA